MEDKDWGKRRKTEKLTFLSAHRSIYEPAGLPWAGIQKLFRNRFPPKFKTKQKSLRWAQSRRTELKGNCEIPNTAHGAIGAKRVQCALAPSPWIWNSPSRPRYIIAQHVPINIWQFEPNDGWSWTTSINILAHCAERKNLAHFLKLGFRERTRVQFWGLIRAKQLIPRFSFLGEDSEFTWFNNKSLRLGV